MYNNDLIPLENKGNFYSQIRTQNAVNDRWEEQATITVPAGTYLVIASSHESSGTGDVTMVSLGGQPFNIFEGELLCTVKVYNSETSITPWFWSHNAGSVDSFVTAIRLK